MAPIPCEAREGLMRAWLEILKERHPDVTWIPAENAAPLQDSDEMIERPAPLVLEVASL